MSTEAFVRARPRLPTDLCISSLLEMMAEYSPHAVAVAAPCCTPLTYARLRRHVHEVRRLLNALGLGRRDHIAVVVRGGPEMASAFLALAACATCAPLNPAYRANEFDFYFSDLNAKALIVQSGIDSPAVDVARARGIAIVELKPNSNGEAGIFTLDGESRADPFIPGPAQPDDTALLLHTSGTTARPKMVPLTHRNICASAGTIAASLDLRPTERCLNLMPLYHIHGLIGGTLSSLVAGASVACPSGFDPNKFFDWLAEFRPSWYTAVPTMHQAILALAAEHADLISRHPLRFIRSCSAPLPPQVMVECERTFNAPVIEAYGMTEAAHQIACNPLPPRARKAGSVGLPTGVDVAIMDASGNLLPRGATGEIVIRGDNVMGGYANNAEANAVAFAHGWFRTGDLGFLDQDGYLFIKGRIKEIINRGGEKISPREVDEVLLDHPAVAQAVTFALPHATLGEDVAVAVVLREHAAATEAELREFAAQRLAAFKVPARALIVNNIPKGPTGKLSRLGLAEQLAPQLQNEFVGPTNALEESLAHLWARLLHAERVGIHDNFFELGGDSLLGARMLAHVADLTSKNLPLSILFHAPTVARLTLVLRQSDSSSFWRSLVPIQPSGSRPPLFFVHCGNGNVLRLYNLARYLGSDQPFYGLQAQGLDGIRPPLSRIEEMAVHYIDEIRTVQPEGPYILGGICLGGLVAFEMAQQLHRRSERVALLALVDTYLHDYVEIPQLARSFRTEIDFFLRRVAFHIDNFAHIGLQRWPGYIGKKVFGRVMVKTEQPPEDPFWSPAGVANHQAARKYYPQVYPGRVTIFLAGERDHLHRPHEVPALPGQHGHRVPYDPRMPGWLAASGTEIHRVPAGHQEIVLEPYVRVLAEKLRACIDHAAMLP